MTEINNLILEAVNNLENNQYENAVRKYNDIKIKFSGIEQEYKAELKSEIIVLCHKIDISYITMLVKEANYHLISSNKEKAASSYKIITQLYKRVAPEYKAQVLHDCKELYSKLNAKT